MVSPAARPGVLSGNVTRQNTRQAGAPSVRAASSSEGLMRARDEASGSTIIGRNTCREPMTTAVSEYMTFSTAGPNPSACSSQFTTPALLFANSNCQP